METHEILTIVYDAFGPIAGRCGDGIPKIPCRAFYLSMANATLCAVS